jgi:hypothetical protein
MIYFVGTSHVVLCNGSARFCSRRRSTFKTQEEINLQNTDSLVKFSHSLFSYIPVEEVSQIFRIRLNMDLSFSDCSSLQVQDIMKLLDICLKTIYFQEKDTFYHQKEGMAI